MRNDGFYIKIRLGNHCRLSHLRSIPGKEHFLKKRPQQGNRSSIENFTELYNTKLEEFEK